jgi:undecaprenyl-diphosphatase
LVHKAIKIYLFTPQTVAWALAVGALAILLVEGLSLKTKYTSLESMTPRLALGIGCFQCLALWPGFSRSASTILGGMLLGADRKLATEYSFIAAVPIMIAATGFDLLSHWTLLERGDMLVLAIGFVFAFVSAWAAVKLFISLVQKISLRPFAYYRLILAPLVLYFWS